MRVRLFPAGRQWLGPTCFFGSLALLGLLACVPQIPGQTDGYTEGEQTDQRIGHLGSVPHLRTDVIDVLPHDPASFTQGLELAGPTLLEGTGTHGESAVRATDPHTGRSRQDARLPPELFGEGITVVGDNIWQLTWQEEVALHRDRATLREIGRAHYSGEGWGLCHDGKLIMSDGSSRLTFRDPNTFAETGHVEVTADGQPLTQLNELECVDGQVWANVWGSDHLVRIDPGTGAVNAVADASGLLSAQERAHADVLNGIAAVPGTDQFLLTGKNWPHTYRVRLIPA